MNLKKIIKEYFTILKKEDINNLSSILNNECILYTPFEGEIKGRNNIKKYFINQKEWLNSKKAKVDVINTIENNYRIIVEFIIFYDKQEKSIELPAVAVLDIDNKSINSIRIYHTTLPITGEHVIIQPGLEPEPSLDDPDIISLFIQGIKNGDIDFILSLFEDDAYIQEPSGSKFRHHGKMNIEKFYNFALRNGGIPLKKCTSTYDGKNFALEYIFEEWENKKFKPHAGIAVYEISESGKISAIRIYDDLSPYMKN